MLILRLRNGVFGVCFEMKDSDLLTVIVPVYKVEKYLRRCLDSIVNQTYKNLEIILVDDGSPDNCPAICDEYAKKDSRIKVIHQKNKGLSGARNAGLDVATGDYIAFVDSDDWLELDAYEVTIQKMNKEKLDLVAFGYISECLNGSKFVEAIGDIDEFIDGIMCDKEYCCVWRFMYRNKIFDDLRFEIGALYEDSLIVADVFWRVDSFGLVPTCFYHYTHENEGSIMHRSKENIRKFTMFKVFQKNAYYCEQHDRLQVYEIIVAKIYRLGLWCYMQNLKDHFLSVEQQRDILDVLEQVDSLNCFSKIRLWDRIKYWSINHSLYMTNLIAYIQK